MHISQTNSYCSGEGAAPQNPSSKRNPKSAEVRFLAAPRSRNHPMGWEWKGQGESASAASVRGPSDWRSVIRKHCEALNIRWTPQKRNGYYSKQIFSSMRDCGELKKLLHDSPGGVVHKKKRSARTRLRPEKAVIDSPRFASPTFYFWNFGAVPLWGRL